MSPGTPLATRRVPRAGFAALLLAIWCLSGALVSSPLLHHWLHPDASAPSHDCFFTQIGKGSMLVGTADDGLLLRPHVIALEGAAPEVRPAARPDVRATPPRAPPAAPLLPMVVG